MHDQRSDETDTRFKLYFKLTHKDGVNSVFYRGRSFTDDCQQIFDAVRNLELFSPHKCELEIDPRNNECAICFENVDLPHTEEENERTFEDIKVLLGETLAEIGLAAHFYPFGHPTVSGPSNKKTINFRYDKGQLRNNVHKTVNEKRLEKMEFHLSKVPKEYGGYRGIIMEKIQVTLMDIPYYDIMQPETLVDYATAKRFLRYNGSPINPKIHCYTEDGDYDYIMWDKIMTFMEKVELVYREANAEYGKYMDSILNERLSSIAFTKQLLSKKNEAPNLAVSDFFSLGIQAYKSCRYSNAIYYLQQILALLEKAENKDESTFVDATIYCFIAQLKTGDGERVIEGVGELQANHDIQKNDAYPILLINLANYYLTEQNFQEARSLLMTAKRGYLSGKNIPDFLSWSSERKLYLQLILLSQYEVQKSAKGYCKALRNAAARGTPKNLQACIDNLYAHPDARDLNPQKGFTALHWAIIKERPIHAWLLKIMGASFNVPNARWENEYGALQGGKTPSDMIKESENEEMKLLLQPYMRLNINLKNVGKDEKEHNNLIVRRLPLLLKKLGLAGYNAIYLSSIKTIVLPSLFLNGALKELFYSFLRQVIESTEELGELFDLETLLLPAGQSNLLTAKELCFTYRFGAGILNQCTTQCDTSIRSGKTNMFQVISNHSQDMTNTAMFLHQLLRNMNLLLPLEQGMLVNKNPEIFPFFTVSLTCQFADYLHGFLKQAINSDLRLKYGDYFVCEEISEVRPENTPEPSPQPPSKLRR